MASFSTHHLLFLSLLLLPCFSIANVTLGSSFTTDDKTPWASPSGDFAFGFRRLNDSNLFLLAIWFNKIPDRTIVWYANGDKPVPRESKVELTAEGLVLSDPGGQTVWDARPGTAVSDAAMLDTGNFVLSGNGSAYVWESFRNPTDTILPTQKLDLGAMLISRLTENNFSRGRFELHFRNGGLQLNPTGWPGGFLYQPYFTSQTDNTDLSESGYQLVFNESADIYIVARSGKVVQISGWKSMTSSPDYYYRAAMDFDGVFTQYACPKNSGSGQGWWPLRSIPENICTDILNEIGSGACGFNSYCSIQNQRPRCDCPPGYVLVDPTNSFGGCRPKFSQECGVNDGLRNPEQLFEIKEFRNVNWPLGDYERLEPSNQTECEKSCLHDCYCAVAIYSGVACWKKKLPLSNGREDNNPSAVVLFKVRKGVSAGDSDNSDHKMQKSILPEKGKSILAGAILLGGSVLFNLVLLVLISLLLFRLHNRKGEISIDDSSVLETNLRCFSYRELEEATEEFKEEVGRGSFGIVYKGVLKYGSRNVVAVKKLEKYLVQEREREFKAEVSAIGKTHHRNLVRLLGFCSERSHRLLVYEFMSNGALADFLFSLPRPGWKQRVSIAMDAARGLIYLHEECDVPIIHCDIKPQNILLDEHFIPRISDFGLAKLLLSDQSRTRTMIRGTRGYVAPEWFRSIPVTAKVDVYSYGVMLLEIICCRKNVVPDMEEEGDILIDWAYDCYIEGRVDVLVGNEELAMEEQERLKTLVMIAIWCIQEDPLRRPTMKTALQMLEGIAEVPLPPHPSSFFTH